jgi:hypothetical protein
MADDLFVFHSELQNVAPAIARIWGIGNQDQKSADKVPDLAKEITSRKQIGRLILFYHGYPGGIILDDYGVSLSDKVLADAFAKSTTKIEHIGFEGCWVGEAPDEMAAFGRLFGNADVSGFTWTTWTGEITVDIPKGVTPDGMSKVLKPFEPWLMPGSPTIAQLASMSRSADAKATLKMLWYQAGIDEKPPYLGDNLARLGRHSYKARKEATKRSVSAKKAVRSNDPVSPFEYVTVTFP